MKAPTIPGFPVKNPLINSLVKIADLIYFDGPILSLFRAPEGENYLYLWLYTFDDKNSWCVFQVTENGIMEYLDKKVTLLSLIMNPPNGYLYIVNIDDDLNFGDPLLTVPGNLPKEFLPSADSIYEFTPNFLWKNLNEFFKITIDEKWNLEDLDDFPSLYSRVYAFTHTAEVAPSSGGSYQTFPLKDGFSSVHFFNDLLRMLPVKDIPRFQAIKCASPGSITLTLNAKVAVDVSEIVLSFIKNEVELRKSYRHIHSVLAQEKLLGQDVIKYTLDANQKRSLKSLGVELANQISAKLVFENILSRSENELMAIKVLLAFYRRLERLAIYSKDGRVSFKNVMIRTEATS